MTFESIYKTGLSAAKLNETTASLNMTGTYQSTTEP